MRLLQIQADGQVTLTEHGVGESPPYAILSHTWGLDREEVTFKELEERTGQHKSGYRKLTFCGKQAANDGLQYFWVDTCCIDKSSSAELSEAITCMFQWYAKAAKCYAYLSDVSVSGSTGAALPSKRTWERHFRNSRWFTRGWTLQELLAPVSVDFFSVEGQRLGSRTSLLPEIHDVTGIPGQALQGIPLHRFSIEQRLLWMRGRKTKRGEDMAYSLLGMFGVFMPSMYGEGEDHAMYRLQGAIEDAAKNRGQTYLSALTAEVARESKADNNTETSWMGVMESRKRYGSCLNCGDDDHWEARCERVCGRCETPILISWKCES
jgi:hypothetical protein